MIKKFLKFPDNFFWGTATSAHQIEGDCGVNDWSPNFFIKYKNQLPWCQDALAKIPAVGLACDHYNRCEEDFALLQKINNNTYRLSLEWARIEPVKGVWDKDALEHYRQMLISLKNKNIKIFLTLHHFTNPAWLAAEGGWLNPKAVKYFCRYAKFIAEEFGNLVDFWLTVNEPGSYVFCGYLQGFWVPLQKSWWQGLRVFCHLARAHRRAYRLIHQTVKNKFGKEPLVGFANDVQAYANYVKHRFLDQLHVYLVYKISNHGFYILSGKKSHDFLALNYYFPVRLERRGLLFGQLGNIDEDRRTTETNWLIHPHGIYEVLMDLSVYKKPIYITENGIATNDEDLRERFIHEHLEETYYAIKAGADVRGYFYWSLLDNYEWAEGYRPKFGLIAVDPKTQERQLKKSAFYYTQIIKENGLWLDY